MHKAIIVFIFSVVYNYSIAQDTLPAQWNIRVSYYAGLQFFNNYSTERTNHEILAYKMGGREGITSYGQVGPTILQQIELEASLFKDKTWYIGIGRGWGKNNVSSYGEVLDTVNNKTINYEGRTDFRIWFTGYFIQKEIELKKWGKVSPFIGFYPWFFFKSRTNVFRESRFTTTGELIENGNIGGGADFWGVQRWGVLMLFDSPKIGFTYSKKIFPHVLFTFNYSYWWVYTMPNNLYIASNEPIIRFKNSNSIFTRISRFNHSFFGHNLSLGLSIQLRK